MGSKKYDKEFKLEAIRLASEPGNTASKIENIFPYNCSADSCLLYFSGVKYFSRAEVREIAPPAYSFIFIEKENVIYAYDRKFFISSY